MAKTRHFKFAHMFTAGLLSAALAAPMAASASNALVGGTVKPSPVIALTPEQMIQAKAAALGAGFTGLAVSGLEVVPTGHRIRYQNCDIYYSPAAGAHEVHGGIRDKYNVMGGALGHLGLPRTDELVTSDGVGRYNEFAGDASIYWSPDTGPFAVEGNIRRAWVAHGAESGKFGYPTAAVQFQNGGQWGDFQDDVIHFEGLQQRTPETAGLTREQLTRWLRKFVRAGLSAPVTIESFSIRSVSNTGYDFSQSRNRRVTVHLAGSFPVKTGADTTYTLDLHLLFFAQKEADGSTSLRMMLVDSSWLVKYHGADDGGTLASTMDDFVRSFASPVKLIDVTIPAAVPVLSFKVLEDGALKLYLQPGGGAPLVQLAVQLAFDRLAQ